MTRSPVLFWHLEERPVARHARIVDQTINVTVPALRPLGER